MRRATKKAEREQRFAEEYLVDLNATAAVRRMGIAGKRPDVVGSKLLARPSVQALIAERREEIQKRTGVSQDYVIATIRETIDRCRTFPFTPNAVLKGCELLGSHFGMWKQINEHTGKDGAPLAPPVINIGFENGGPGG